MAADGHFTFNPLSNEDKELLLSHGYVLSELTPEEAQDILRDLRVQSEDYDSEHPFDIGDEKDDQTAA